MNLKKFININWYIDRKPYSHHTEYDIFYLNICRRLFELIEKTSGLRPDTQFLEREESRKLAYILTAYFEDRVNNIGFWDALVALHQKQFGKRLPFFEPEQLEEEAGIYDDIFPSDIHYLIYVSCIQILTEDGDKPVIPFESPFLITLTEQVFEYLDQFDEVSETGFYEDFLIPPGDYFEFKKKMFWFTYSSYLTGIEFNGKIQKMVKDEMEEREKTGKADDDIFAMAFYGEEDRLMFESPSSLTGFFPVDLFAGALRCNNKKKAEVLGLKWRPYGIFELDEDREKYFHFTHTATGEEFNVLKDSFDQPDQIASGATFWLTKLAYWDGDYCISGSCLGYPLSFEEVKKENEKEQHLYQKHFKPYRDKLMRHVTDFRNAAAEFFGSDLIPFDSGWILQEKMDEFNRWYFDRTIEERPEKAPSQPAKFKFQKEVLNTTDLVLFLPAHDNICLVLEHEKHLKSLKDENVSSEDISDTLYWLLNETVDADYCFYIREHFDFKNLENTLPSMTGNSEDFEALMRIYKPFHFSPLRLPRFSLKGMDEEL